MALKKGGEVQSGSGGMFLKADKDKATICYLLTDKEGIFSTDRQVQCFTQSGGPTNVTWIDIGPGDPHKELGLKADGYAAWIPVGVYEEGEWRAKLWQTNKTLHGVIAGLENEWSPVVGVRIKIAMVNKRWTVSALPPLAKSTPANPAPTPADIQAMVDALPSDDEVEKMITPVDIAGVKELLIKRLGVQTWGQVLTAFGANAPASEDIEVEAV